MLLKHQHHIVLVRPLLSLHLNVKCAKLRRILCRQLQRYHIVNELMSTTNDWRRYLSIMISPKLVLDRSSSSVRKASKLPPCRLLVLVFFDANLAAVRIKRCVIWNVNRKNDVPFGADLVDRVDLRLPVSQCGTDVAFKTDDFSVVISALFRSQPPRALLRSALRLWLYFGCICAEFLLRLFLDLFGKLGGCCCNSAESRGYNRIGEPGSQVPSPLGSRYPFVYTDHLRAGRDSEGRKFLNSYMVLQTLDTGSSGKVKLAVDTNTNEYYVRSPHRSSCEFQPCQKSKANASSNLIFHTPRDAFRLNRP